MDIFGTIASTIDLATKIVGYIQAVKGAEKERSKLCSEVSAVGVLLTALHDRLGNTSTNPDNDDVSKKLIEAGIGGLLLQCYKDLESIMEELERIASPTGEKKSSPLLEMMKNVKWPFRQEDIKTMLGKIERLKSLISLALQTSLMDFVKETRDELKNLGLDHMKAIVSALEGAQNTHTKETESLHAILRDLVTEFQGFTNNAAKIEGTVAIINRNQKDHMMKGDLMQADLTIIKENMYNQELQDLVKWLSPLDFGDKHSMIFEKRACHTGEWFLQHPKFLAWRQGDAGCKTLWCPGNPGVGKSVMASLVINKLGNAIPENTALVFVYFEYKTKYTVTQLIEVILKQLVRQRITQSSLESLRKHKAGIRPTSGELFDMLKIEVGTYDRILVVIDALDEADAGAWTPLLENIQALPNIGILATSRDVSEIGLGLQPHRRLDIVADEGDVEGRLASSVKFKQLLKDRLGVHGEIITGVMAKADGMFLLAQLHMNSLEAKLRVSDLRRALGTLPNTLDATYDEAMSRINEDHKALAYRIISWLIHAAQPMTIQDLQYALAIEDEMTALDTDDLYDEAFLTSICVGLVVVREDTADAGSKIVGLVHYTTQQYFLGTPNLSATFADSPDFAITCLKYLAFDIFKIDVPLSEESKKQFEETPFALYAIWSWGIHACKHWGNKIVRDLVTELLDDDQRVVVVGSLPCRTKNLSGIHLSTHFGLEDYVKSLLDNGCDINLKDSDGDMAVTYAATNGQEEIMQLLLAREGVDINPMGWENYTPLARAILAGDEAIVRLLLARNDLDVNLRKNSGNTPVFAAALMGHSGIVELLLARDDVNINLQGQDGRTPLFTAAHQGHEAIVRLLLARNDVDVNLRSDSGNTPVLIAASIGHSGIVGLLLARDGVDINLQNQYRNTPLSAAVHQGHEAAVRLLLARNDLDVNLRDNSGNTPAFTAVLKGHSGIVELLLARDGVDINLQGLDGYTPLSEAVYRGHEAVVRLLLARNDVDVNLRNNFEDTPVFIAASKGHSGIVELLLARDGVDINLQDQDGNTPLSLALEKGHEAIIQLLLARADLDVGQRAKDGVTYLAIAAAYNNEEAAKWFLAKGMDINSKNSKGRGPLALAARQGSDAVVELLLDQDGIDVNPVDSDGQTPLDHAIRERRERIIELLRAAGGRTNMPESTVEPREGADGNVGEDGNEGEDGKDDRGRKDNGDRRDDEDKKDEGVRKDKDKKDEEVGKDDEDETVRVDREDEDNGQDEEVKEVEVNMKEGAVLRMLKMEKKVWAGLWTRLVLRSPSLFSTISIPTAIED